MYTTINNTMDVINEGFIKHASENRILHQYHSGLDRASGFLTLDSYGILLLLTVFE